MDCEQCGAPLDISATKDTHLRCSPCRLLFIVKEDGELQGLAVKAPPGFDQAEFFASFTRNLGFEDDDEPESASGPVAEGGAERRSRAPLFIGLLLVVVMVIVAAVVVLGRGGGV
jgi:hypothetical protein